MELVEKFCEAGCGKGFRVMPTSPQKYCSFDCELQKTGATVSPWRPKGHEKLRADRGKDFVMAKSKGVSEGVLSIGGLSEKLNISKATLYFWASKEKIPSKRTSSGQVFDLEAVKAAIEKNGLGTRKRKADVRKDREPETQVVQATRSVAVDVIQIKQKAWRLAREAFKQHILSEARRAEVKADHATELALLKELVRSEALFDVHLGIDSSGETNSPMDALAGAGK
jgi:DNA-binding transcriptional MerR regulator